MGAAYFFLPETELPDMATVDGISGNSLASTSMEFDDKKLYEKLDITPLEEFVGGAGLDFGDEDLGELTNAWFDPTDGLKTVVSMKSHIIENKDQFSDPADTLNDLEAFEKSLQQCVEHSTRWCLGIDV